MRLGSRIALRSVDVTIEGAANVPERGPAIIAARHYHHLYDGCALLQAVPRQVHVVAGLDWLEPGLAETMMRRACEAARWPIVTRPEKGADIDRERFAESRRAYADIMALLRDDRIVLIFPEGYPAIDPHPSPRPAGEAMLPFQRGFAQIAMASTRSGMTVPVVPAGLAYESD
ncbi:MAG: lysophospholipid acyltransferase family protein, partial [Planctomycetaceae bacterium]